METTQLTIRLPKSEMMFLEEYTKRHKISISELIDIYIKQLQQIEDTPPLLSDLDEEFEQHVGIIPMDVDVEKEYYDYLKEKHK